MLWRSSLDILCTTTEQVGDLELSHSGDVGCGVMQGLGARLAMFDGHGWQKRVVHHSPLVLAPLHRGIQSVVFDAQMLRAQSLPSSR